MIGLIFVSCKPIERWQVRSYELYVNTEANEKSVKVVIDVCNSFSKATGFNFRVVGRHKAGLWRDNRNTISFMKLWPSTIPMSNVAYTKRWLNKQGDIDEADIIINMQSRGFTTAQERQLSKYFFEGVLAHELGHFLGLEHSRSKKSLMWHYKEPLDTLWSGELDEETRENLKKLYP